MRNGFVSGALVGLFAVALSGATGCNVRVDKSENGDGDHVKIATPFGSIAVNKGQASASDVGLPTYPGATLRTDDDGNKSAKVDMGFGSWKLRVRVAHYTTTDKRDQVLAFYRKALGEYGGVITCEGDKPIGSLAATSEGLTCEKSDYGNKGPHNSVHSSGLELKAGSPHHQHLVLLDGDGAPATSFSLIALDLPHGPQNEQEGTN